MRNIQSRAEVRPAQFACPHSKYEKEEATLRVLWSIVVGFFAGLIARAVHRGTNPMGVVKTIIPGIIGSIVGGLIARCPWKHEPGQKLHLGAAVVSIVGAVMVLFVWQRFT